MYVQLFVAATLMAIGLILFGHFERYTPIWRRLSKLVLLFGTTALLHRFAGPMWSWLWIFGLFGLGLGVHAWWTHKHGIGLLSAEPQDKYYALRGWHRSQPKG